MAVRARTEPHQSHKKLDNKQDRIHYRIDIYSSSISLKPVIHPIKESDKIVSNNKTF